MALMCHCEILKANIGQVGPKELIKVTLKLFKHSIMSGKVKVTLQVSLQNFEN